MLVLITGKCLITKKKDFCISDIKATYLLDLSICRANNGDTEWGIIIIVKLFLIKIYCNLFLIIIRNIEKFLIFQSFLR
jgi:hypothetical protein